MAEQRPNPEKLLKRVEEEERKKQRGKFKIYLGYAPGVGKTYTMLHDALSKRSQGLDVVIGLVETHGRKEITSLIKDFETILDLIYSRPIGRLNEAVVEDKIRRQIGALAGAPEEKDDTDEDSDEDLLSVVIGDFGWLTSVRDAVISFGWFIFFGGFISTIQMNKI